MRKQNVFRIVVYGLIIIGISSCAVTNNMYLNDATPYEKGDGIVSFGIGTGLMPDLDSVTDKGDIHYSNKFRMAPNFYLGLQGNIKNKLKTPIKKFSSKTS